jgi:hypothetical protein
MLIAPKLKGFFSRSFCSGTIQFSFNQSEWFIIQFDIETTEFAIDTSI